MLFLYLVGLAISLFFLVIYPCCKIASDCDKEWKEYLDEKETNK